MFNFKLLHILLVGKIWGQKYQGDLKQELELSQTHIRKWYHI